MRSGEPVGKMRTAGRRSGARVGGTPTRIVAEPGFHRTFVAPEHRPFAPDPTTTMVTKLEGQLRREIAIDGNPYVVTLTPSGLTLTEKGRRKGFAMDWSAFVGGDVALATALNASLAAAPPKRPRSPDGAQSTHAARDRPRGTSRSRPD